MSARPRLTVAAATATLLATLSLASVFRDSNWFWPVVLAVGAGAAGCALGRTVGLPRPVVAVPGLLAVLLVISWVYARDVAWLGVFPGRGALRELSDLAGTGFAGIRKYATPAPTDDGLVLLAAAGAGAVAVVVDTIAVTYRSAALAGVPLLLLYSVPITVVRGGVPWLLFVVAALGWLALMLAEGRERLSGWGRPLGRRTAHEDPLIQTPPEPLGVVGRRIGAAAVGLALILPAVVPWAGTNLFRSGTGGGGSGGVGGAGPVASIDPIAQLGGFLIERSETTLLTYTSSDLNPDYLRVVTLDHFNGTAWLPARQVPAGSVSDEPPAQYFGVGILGQLVTTSISIRNLAQVWLPVTYPGGSVTELTGSWSYDRTTGDVFSTGGYSTRGQNYTVFSRHLLPTAQDLRAVGPAPDNVLVPYTALPAGIPDSVRTLTDSIVAGKTSDYDKALALQTFFLDPANHFQYTTDPPAAKGNALAGFLRIRQGFCQQYATTYAVMARLAGLPTRVEIGFTPGSGTIINGERQVTNHNAHAWPEVFFNGIGWVRFEPTVSNTTGGSQPSWAVDPNLKIGSTQGTAGGATGGVRNRFQLSLTKDTTAQGRTGQGGTSAAAPPASFPWALLIAGLAVVVLLLPGVARLARRRRRLGLPAPRGADDGAKERVGAAWAEVADTARDLHDPWPASRTPRRTVEWLTDSGIGPSATAAAWRLARAVERVRYARDGADPLAGSDPAADARAVVTAMESAATPRNRWRARMIPVSVLGAVSERLADILDWTDVLGARIRDLFRRPLRRRTATARS